MRAWAAPSRGRLVNSCILLGGLIDRCSLFSKKTSFEQLGIIHVCVVKPYQLRRFFPLRTEQACE